MAEKIFNEQTNYGWGLTFNLTGKAPAISKRIFDKLEDAKLFANDYNDSAVEGILLSVVNDNDNNGVYFVEKIKSNSDDTDAILVKLYSGNVDDFVKEVEDDFKEIDAQIKKIDSKIGDISEDETVLSLISNLDGSINDNKSEIDSYTINDKKISTNPILTSTDITIDESYSTITNNSENVIPGEIITTAISKLEIMLANTTLALTAAINDLESRIGTASEYDDEGNLIKEGTGLIYRIEQLEK